MARDVAEAQACSGAKPSQSFRAACEYGTRASSTVCEAPGTQRSRLMAKLPPPVTEITARSGDA